MNTNSTLAYQPSESPSSAQTRRQGRSYSCDCVSWLGGRTVTLAALEGRRARSGLAIFASPNGAVTSTACRQRENPTPECPWRHHPPSVKALNAEGALAAGLPLGRVAAGMSGS